MSRRISMIILSLILTVVMVTTPAFAMSTKILSNENNNLSASTVVYDFNDSKDGTRTDGYTYWVVASQTPISHPFGSWRLGPRGLGPATLTLNNSSGYNISVTNTISGSYTSVADISASLRVSINVSIVHSCSYSVSPPSGVRWRIIYRPQYTRYKIVQKEYYRIDGQSSPTGNTKTCYVNVFLAWDYSHRVE